MTTTLPYDASELSGAAIRFMCEVREDEEVIAHNAYTVDVFPFQDTWSKLDAMSAELQALNPAMPDADAMIERADYLSSRIQAMREPSSPPEAQSRDPPQSG